MTFTIRNEEGADDRDFMLSLSPRFDAVTNAPTHSKDDVRLFHQRFIAQSWDDAIQVSHNFIAVGDDDTRLGFINLRETEDDIANEKCAYIALIAISAEATGLGVAPALISKAADWARGAGYKRLCLDVFSSNAHAQNFYEKAGFEPETVRVVKRL